MKNIVVALFVILLVLHQDFWAWDDPTLVLGFMPIGLFYHAVFALAAAGLGVLAIKFMWPASVDADEASGGPEEKGANGDPDMDLLD